MGFLKKEDNCFDRLNFLNKNKTLTIKKLFFFNGLFKGIFFRLIDLAVDILKTLFF